MASENSDTPVSQQGYDYDFLQAIEAVQANTQALTTLIPKEFAALSRTIQDVYKNAGPSRGTAAGRSMPSISGNSSLSGTTDATARAILAGQDITEAEVEGNTSTMGGPSWQARVRRGGLGQILPMPRFPGAQPNTADLLNYASTVAANWADSRQQTLNQRAQTNYQSTLKQMATEGQVVLDGNGNPVGPLTEDVTNRLTEAATPQSTNIGKISDAFSGLENAYAQGKYIRGIMGKVLEPAAAMRNYGYQSGYSGGSSPLFLGLRSPFDGGVGAGLGQHFSQFGFALGNNVTPGQAGEIYNNLFSRGWYGGGSTNDMRTASASIMRANPYIGSMPATYDMMDKTTRQGATSLSEFVSIMKQVPDAAKAAHTSITDTMAQMDSMGMYNTQIGGTYGAGLNNALAWQSVTGLPTAIMQQLMQNPMVIGQTYAATGLMPQMQGLASPFQHVQGIMGSLNMLNRAIISPANKSYKDPITGLTQQIGGQKQKEALIAQQLGIPQDVVHTMLSNQTGWMHGAELLNAGQTYSSAVDRAVRSGNMSGAYHDLISGYRGIQSSMKDAVDSQGHKIFEDWGTYRSLVSGGMSAKQAHSQAQLMARRRVTNAGDTDVLKDANASSIEQAMRESGLGDKYSTNSSYSLKQLDARQRATVAQRILKDGNVSGRTMRDVSRDRSREMTKYINENTQKFGTGNQGNNGPKLQIELGPAARKVMHLSDPTGQQKANANAGTASINLNSYVNGATAAPYPNLDTAGQAATYNYGGQDDFNSAMGY